jgi:hypothetical protein
VVNASTGQPLISAAGITQYGTRSAGEFLTNPKYMEQLGKRAPGNWQRRNVQVVIATKVIDGNSGPPGVVATHFW